MTRRKPGLPGVNVPIALIDPAREFHAPAHFWFQHKRTYGWATCPITLGDHPKSGQPLAQGCECAGMNRHVVGDERALQKRSSDSILTLILHSASRGVR